MRARRSAPPVKRPRRHLLRGFATVVVLVGLLAGGWLWVRDSALARVTQVRVTGATSSDEGRIRAALERAARDMTTLHVRERALYDAVAPYPSVAGLKVETDFPHAMRVEVLEHRPVAAFESDGSRTPVSGDGIVLNGVQADRTLPAIRRDRLPAHRVDDERTRAALTVAAAAPQPLLERSERLSYGPDGLTVDLRDGPPLVFGAADDAAAKWAAAARVLAEPTAAGATYLDLRVTGRVAAGGLGPLPEEEESDVPQP
jgi:cell division protein FtsQ